MDCVYRFALVRRQELEGEMTTYQWLSILVILAGGIWKLNRTLTKIEIALSGKVGFDDCRDRQQECPCHKEIEKLQKKMERLHPLSGERS
jgi:hypothetical protein